MIQTRNHQTIVTQFKEGNIVKYLIAVSLLFVSLSVYAEEEIPETITPEEEPSILLSSEECSKLAHQMDLLSTVIEETDKKTSQMRTVMNNIRDTGIIPLLKSNTPFSPQMFNIIITRWYDISVEHHEYQIQRNIAYDGREEAFNKLKEGCNYRPGGES